MMKNYRPTFLELTAKTITVHTVTYFLIGFLSFVLLDYSTKFADPNIAVFMRQTDDALVMAGPLFQPIRGLLFAIVFYLLREVLFNKRNGWAIMWLVLMVPGILSTFGPAPGSIEGLIYTILPLRLQLAGLPEVILQSLLLSLLLCYWVNQPQKKWLSWVLGVIFFLTLLLPVLGLTLGQANT
jgi:hypothetical protein